MNHDLFISYSHKNSQVAETMCNYLEQRGIQCWMAPRDIPMGAKYASVITQAIKESKVVVVIFSHDSASSPWVEGEINIAFSNRKPIIPYKIDNTSLENFDEFYLILNNRHWIESYPDYTKYMNRLAEEVSIIVNKPLMPIIQTPHKEEPTPTYTPIIKMARRGGSRKLRWWYMAIVLITFISIGIALMFILGDSNEQQPIQQSNNQIETPKNQDFSVELGNGKSINMIWVEGGTFAMGSPEEHGDNDEHPQHTTQLDGFWIAETEITQGQWFEVMASTIKDQRDKANKEWTLYGQGENHPMYYVNYYEATEFCDRLTRITSKKFSLPTEAEWEYAAMGGDKRGEDRSYTLIPGESYSGSNCIDSVAWYEANSNNKTHPVKLKKPNELGLYDMSGNVYEWCKDIYGSYSDANQANPKGRLKGKFHVLRGGGWGSKDIDCRANNRYCDNPDNRYSSRGFRIVCRP